MEIATQQLYIYNLFLVISKAAEGEGVLNFLFPGVVYRW